MKAETNEKIPSAAWLQFQKSMETPRTKEAELFVRARSGEIAPFLGSDSPETYVSLRDEKGYSLLMLAAYHGHEALSELLLKQGADPNFVDASGNSILMGVAFKGHLAVAKLLFAYGVNVNYKNPKGQSANDFAVMFGRKEMVSFLERVSNSESKPNQRLILWLRYLFSPLKSLITQFFASKGGLK